MSSGSRSTRGVLAVAQTVTPKPVKGRSLAGRLAENAAVLLKSHRIIAQMIDLGSAITPAAEWLVDNYYLVERQIREIRSASAARLLSATAQAGRRAVRGISAGIRRGLGLCRPHRQPLRSRDAVPLRARLSGGAAADDRRALGGRHHARGSCWSKTSTRSPNAIVRSGAARQEADALADRLLGAGGRAVEPVSAVLADAERQAAAGRLRRPARATGCATRIPGSRRR